MNDQEYNKLIDELVRLTIQLHPEVTEAEALFWLFNLVGKRGLPNSYKEFMELAEKMEDYR